MIFSIVLAKMTERMARQRSRPVLSCAVVSLNKTKNDVGLMGPCLSAIFPLKGNNFCDSLFASLDDIVV